MDVVRTTNHFTLTEAWSWKIIISHFDNFLLYKSVNSFRVNVPICLCYTCFSAAKISKSSQENTCDLVFYVVKLKACSLKLTLKRLHHRIICYKIVKSIETGSNMNWNALGAIQKWHHQKNGIFGPSPPPPTPPLSSLVTVFS